MSTKHADQDDTGSGAVTDEVTAAATDAADDAAIGPAAGSDSGGTSDAADSAAGAAADRQPKLVRTGLPLVALVLAVVAFAAAVVFGVFWWGALTSNDRASAQARDGALQAAEIGAVNFTTLDYKNIQAGLARWKSSATGDLYTQLTSGANTFESQVQTAKVTTTGTVVDGALTDLNVTEGKASAIVLVRVQVTPSTGQAATKELPLDVELTNTGSQSKPDWKLSGLSQISTGTGSTSTPTAGQ